MQGQSSPDRGLLDADAMVGHLVAGESVYRFLADHRGRVFPDDLFSDLFESGRGRPSQPADVVATVLVLQSLEGLSDRDACEALRTDIRWKVAAGLTLDDEGFHPTVLTYWRRRLRDSERPERIFDAVRDVIAETGVLVGKNRRALDSTLLDDAVATQDTVTQLVSMIRRVRKVIDVAAAVTVTTYRDGYKAHVAVEPETGIIAACDLTPANHGDGPAGVKLLDGEDPGLQVLADSAYGSGQVRADLAAAKHHAVIKPLPQQRNQRLGDDQFSRDDFVIDYDNRTVTCPAGQTVTITGAGNAVFGKRCNDCPLRDRCTAATDGKTMKIGEHDELLATARTDWRTGKDIDDYRQHRPMVERSIAWLVRNGHRRVAYRGVEANRLGLSHRAAAINLQRLNNLGIHHNGDTWQSAA